MALVELARFYNGFEASLARSRLEAEGIGAVLFDMEMNWGGLDGAVPVRLMVNEEDRDEAAALLSRDRDGSA